MSRILFTHSYFYRFDPKQWKAQQPYPPYGTMMAAAVMRDCGFSVDLFDTNLRHSADEILPVLEARSPRYLVIYDDGFNYLTKMCLTRMREAAFAMAKYGKKQGCTVASVQPCFLLNSYIISSSYPGPSGLFAAVVPS